MMKLLVILASVLTIGLAQAEWSNDEAMMEVPTTKVFAEVDGELQEVEVSEDAFLQLVNHNFYYCAWVGNGYRRCSKRRAGSCFGATFRNLRQCQSVLHPEDND